MKKLNNLNMSKVGRKRIMQCGWYLEIELGLEMFDMIYNFWKKKISDFIFDRIIGCSYVNMYLLKQLC